MDELIHHCLREISFDGDLGCDISRLDHFIDEFYKPYAGSEKQAQLVDADFRSFVISLLAQEPSVTIGLVPEGSAPVYITPQPSATRKLPAKSRRTQKTPASLEPTEVSELDFNDLGQYGGTLRIAVDHETSFMALTGSHVRPAKLGGMAYSALQLITRSRTQGISTVELADATGYDAKAIHYLISQLETLGLIHKVRTTGRAKHSCLHKYFYPKSLFYVPPPIPDPIKDDQGDIDDDWGPDDAQADDGGKSMFSNQPLPASDLIIDSLVRRRLADLLKSSPGNLYRIYNILPALGFSKPDIKQTRHFNSQLRHFVREGWIEKVSVPHKTAGKGRVICARLADNLRPTGTEDSAVLRLDSPAPPVKPLMANASLQSQLLQLVDASGTKGIGLIELSDGLGAIDRRTLESVLSRMERERPPPHLVDLTIVQLLETQKREHSLKWFSLKNYRALMSEIGANPKAGLPKENPEIVGGWGAFAPDLFYDSQPELESVINIASKKEVINTMTTLGKGRTNPFGPDGNRVKGRPRNDWSGKPSRKAKSATGKATAPTRRKRKASEAGLDAADVAETPAPGPSRPSVSTPGESLAEGSSSAVKPGRPGRARTGTTTAKPAPQKPAKKPAARSKAKKSTPSVPPETPHTANIIQPEEVDVTSLPDVVNLPSAVTEVVEEAPTPSSSVIGSKRARSPSRESTPSRKRARKDDIAPAALSPEFCQDATAEASLTSKIMPTRPRNIATNVTYMLRVKEVQHLLSTAGGAAVLSDLGRQHLALLEQWSREGRTTSSKPGVSLDRRTLDNVIKEMEGHGLVKFTTTSVSESVTLRRRAITVVYLIGTPEDTIRSVVQAAMQSSAERIFKKPALPMVDGAYQESRQGNSSSTKAPTADQDLVPNSPASIRKEMLSEAQVSAQFFGFIAGRLARARELHLFTISQMTDPNCFSPFFISPTELIVDTRYFWNDLPISTYCSLVPINTHAEALETEMADTEKWMKMKIKAYPQNIKDILESGRARCRHKISEILHMLRELGVALPLVHSSSAIPYATCQTADSSSMSFDVADVDSSPQALVDVPFWQFNLIGPVYAFGRSVKEAPLLGYLPIATPQESAEYWSVLRKAALEENVTLEEEPTRQQVFSGSPDIARTTARRLAWSQEYRFSALQTAYLSRFISPATGMIPPEVDPTNETDPFHDLCWTAAAPEPAVRLYLEGMQRVAKSNLSRQARVIEKKVKDAEREAKVTARRLLAQQVKEAKELMLANWNNAVASAQLLNRQAEPRSEEESSLLEGEQLSPTDEEPPVPLSDEQLSLPGLVRLRKSFFAAGGTFDLTRLPLMIADALSGAAPAKPVGAKTPRPGGRRSGPPPAPEFVPPEDRDLSDPLEQAIMDLIERQQPKPKETNKEKLERRKASNGVPAKRVQRFVWTPDYDELLKDGTAVTAARCRASKSMVWGAVLQLFPALDTASARSRITRLKKDPANAAYILELENAWHGLWLKDRGSDALPDMYPDSTSNFDLVKHVAYLRRHIEKRRLRNGATTQLQDARQPELPDSLLWIGILCTVDEEKPESKWDVMWTGLGDELRERALGKEPFSFHQHPLDSNDRLESRNAVAHAATMMVLETPEDLYDVQTAGELLKSCGDDHTTAAFHDLEKRNYITRVISDLNKRAPGREWRLQDWQEETMSQPFGSKLFESAQRFEDEISDEQQVDLPYVVADGTMAALINLVSDDKVALSVDTSHPARVRDEVDGNSKKIGDDQLETAISIRLKEALHRTSSPTAETVDAIIVDAILDAPHPVWSTIPERVPSCGSNPNAALVDCEGCLDNSIGTILATLAPDLREEALQILNHVVDAGEQGVPKNALPVGDSTYSLIQMLTAGKTPPLFWTGYDHTAPILVSSKYLSMWAAHTSKGSRLIFPKRWLDIHGHRIDRVWTAALRCVVGLVWTRPGINLFDLRMKLDRLFDRQELLELVKYIIGTGLVYLHWDRELVRLYGNSDHRDLQSLSDAECAGALLTIQGDSVEAWYHMKVAA